MVVIELDGRYLVLLAEYGGRVDAEGGARLEAGDGFNGVIIENVHIFAF